MPMRILPVASLRSTKRLPAARALFLAYNYLIYLALWPRRRAILRAEANSLPALREGALPDVSAAAGLGPARPIDPGAGSPPPFPREGRGGASLGCGDRYPAPAPVADRRTSTTFCP